MVLNHISPQPMSEQDENTTYGANTPPETLIDNDDFLNDDFLNDLDPLSTSTLKNNVNVNSSIPWPGNTYLIRSSLTGKLLTLQSGKVLLLSPGTKGTSIHFTCVECKGWLGFRDVASGRYLGYDTSGKVVCNAQKHGGWENFCVRMIGEGEGKGGFLLLMQHWERLWHVGSRVEGGEERIVKVGERMGEGMAWEFVEV